MATMVEENPFELAQAPEPEPGEHVHVYGELKDGKGRIVCVTEDAGKPKNRDVQKNELVVGLGNVIPLWAKDVTLYYRFNPRSFRAFARPDAAKERIRTLLNKALDLWGDCRPVEFAERANGWDFEIVVRSSADCDATGCVLASAFFPDSGRHKLTIYPTLFRQNEQEQIETLVHEIGHVFGLRHFFAKVSETKLPSEIFGTHVEFTIMNYGSKSVLTDTDRRDLKALYEQARSGALTAINGTKIELMNPFNSI